MKKIYIIFLCLGAAFIIYLFYAKHEDTIVKLEEKRIEESREQELRRIENEKAERARIEEEKRLAEERAERARLDAIKNEAEKEARLGFSKYTIEQYADKLSYAVSPGSRENMSWYIDDALTSYNYDTKTVEMTFMVSWMAFVHTIFDNSKKMHVYKGKLHFYGNNDQTVFEEISRNDALREGEEANHKMKNGIESTVTFIEYMNRIKQSQNNN